MIRAREQHEVPGSDGNHGATRLFKGVKQLTQSGEGLKSALLAKAENFELQVASCPVHSLAVSDTGMDHFLRIGFSVPGTDRSCCDQADVSAASIASAHLKGQPLPSLSEQQHKIDEEDDKMFAHVRRSFPTFLPSFLPPFFPFLLQTSLAASPTSDRSPALASCRCFGSRQKDCQERPPSRRRCLPTSTNLTHHACHRSTSSQTCSKHV